MPIVLPMYFAIKSPPYIYNAILNSWTLNPHHGYIDVLDPELDSYVIIFWSIQLKNTNFIFSTSKLPTNSTVAVSSSRC